MRIKLINRRIKTERIQYNKMKAENSNGQKTKTSKEKLTKEKEKKKKQMQSFICIEDSIQTQLRKISQEGCGIIFQRVVRVEWAKNHNCGTCCLYFNQRRFYQKSFHQYSIKIEVFFCFQNP